MAHPILGLDLGARNVKAVLLETTLRGFTVADVAEVPLPPPAEGAATLRERQAAAVRELLAAHPWHPDVTVASMPGTAAAAHLVSLPFTDARRIEQTVPYEVEAAIPFDMEQVAWDWQPLEPRPDRSDLYVGVTRKEELSALLAALAGAGVDPSVVVPAAPALAALWAAGAVADPPGEGEADVAVDVGWDRTHVCVVGGGRCLFARTFPTGAAGAVRAARQALGLPADDGDGISLPAELSAPGGAAAVGAGLGALVRELRTTLRAFEARPARRPVRRVVIAGGGASLPGLPEALSEGLGIPCGTLRLAGPAEARITAEAAPVLALPLALALRGWLGPRFQRLNLRRGDLASTRSLDDLKARLTRVGVYAGLVALLAVVSTAVTAVALSRQEKLLDQALCDVTQKVVGKCFDDYTVAESVLRGRGTLSAAIPKVSATGVLAELAARTPGIPLRFDRVEISRDKLHLQGTTDAAENVDRVVSALKASRCFADARSGGARKRGTEQKFEFTVDADLTCDGPAAPGGKG
jgi:general secretion pathway protein L